MSPAFVRRGLPALALAAWFSTAPALASDPDNFPVGATAQAQSVININPGVSPSASTQKITLVSPGTALSASLNGLSGNGSGQVDLGDGLLRAASLSTAGFSNSIFAWEFLTFDGSADIGFALAVDGVLSNARSAGVVYVDAGVRLYDVTDWSSWFGQTAGVQFVARNGTAPPLVDQVAAAVDRQGVRGSAAASCASLFINTCTTSSNGTPVAVNFTLGGTAPVQAGRVYLLELGMNLGTFNGAGSGLQRADFSNTAVFSFTDLGGLNVTSSSGQFLTPIPEPQTRALWLAGLIAAGLLAGRRRPQR